MSLKSWVIELYLKKEIKKLLEENMNLLKSKTVWSGVGLIIFAISGVLTGHLTTDQAMPILLNGIGLVGIKDAISKVAK